MREVSNWQGCVMSLCVPVCPPIINYKMFLLFHFHHAMVLSPTPNIINIKYTPGLPHSSQRLCAVGCKINIFIKIFLKISGLALSDKQSPVSLRNLPSFPSFSCFPPRHLVVTDLGPVVSRQVDVVILLALAVLQILQTFLSEISPEHGGIHPGHLVVPHGEGHGQVLRKRLGEFRIKL